MQITFIFILILFIDSVNRVYRVQLDVAAYHKDGGLVDSTFFPALCSTRKALIKLFREKKSGSNWHRPFRSSSAQVLLPA